MYLAHDSWLWVMGFAHVTSLGQMTYFMGFDWVQDIRQLTQASQLMDFTLWLTMSHESRDARVCVMQGYHWGKNPYIRVPSRHEIWVTNYLLYTPSDSNLHTVRIHRQHALPHSEWAAPILSGSYTPPSPFTCLFMSLGSGILVSRNRLALLLPAFRSFLDVSLSADMIGNTLWPMLQTAGTTFRSRREPVRRLRLISSFSLLLLEAA